MSSLNFLDDLNNIIFALPENKDIPIKYHISQSSLGGRGVIAKEQIAKGSLIFANKPIVIGPRADIITTNYCSQCYKKDETCYTCDKCPLLICSKECQESENHAPICNFINKYWIVKGDGKESSKTLIKSIVYLKSLVLKEDEFKLFSKLQKARSIDTVSELEPLLQYFDIPEDQMQFMKYVQRVLKVNSFRIAIDSTENIIPTRGVFPISSFLNHSCVPNTRNVFTKNFTMKVYAANDIQPGDEITSCYTGLLWSTPARRHQLYKSKGFWCKCNRCGDNTEMGTRLSALKCLKKECVGVLLPIEPLKNMCDWSCDNCNDVATHQQVSGVQGALGSLLGTIDLDNELRLETFILERLANFIPYSSHVFVDLRLRLSTKIGFSEETKITGIDLLVT